MVVANNKIDSDKNTRQTLANFMAMRIWRCNTGCITQWSTSVASCKATRFRHWASACVVLPRRPPWSSISNETKKTLTKHNLYLAFSWYTDAKKRNNFKTRHGPSTHVLGTTIPDPNPNATIQVEVLSYILSYQM